MSDPTFPLAGIRIPIGFDVVFESPNLTLAEMQEACRDIGNPVLGIRGGNPDDLSAIGEGHQVVVAHELFDAVYDHPEVPAGTLVWMCEFCKHYSLSEGLVLWHEEMCTQRPRELPHG